MLQLQISQHDLVKTHLKLCQDSVFKAMLLKFAGLGGLGNSKHNWFFSNQISSYTEFQILSGTPNSEIFFF